MQPLLVENDVTEKEREGRRRADQDAGAAPRERNVSIGTWNMDHWKRTAQQHRDTWKHLRTGTKADVMLFQESVPPRNTGRTRFVCREIAGDCPWGSSAVASVSGGFDPDRSGPGQRSACLDDPNVVPIGL